MKKTMMTVVASAFSATLFAVETNTWANSGNLDWNTAESWKLKRVPAAEDVAKFNTFSTVCLSSEASIYGLDFADNKGTRTFTGSKLAVGDGGLRILNHNLLTFDFENELEFSENQNWYVTRSATDFQNLLLRFKNMVSFSGDLSITSPRACEAPASFIFGAPDGMAQDRFHLAGALSLHEYADVRMLMRPTAAAPDFALGGTVAEPNAISGDGSVLSLGDYDRDPEVTARLVNPISVGSRGLIIKSETLADTTVVETNVSSVCVAGDIDLGGPLGLFYGQQHYKDFDKKKGAVVDAKKAVPVEFAGKTVVRQSEAGNPAVYGYLPGYDQYVNAYTSIFSDGPGRFANPLALASLNGILTLRDNSGSSNSKGVVIDLCGTQYNTTSINGQIKVADSGSIGVGPVSVLPGGRLSLGAATCRDESKPVTLERDTVAEAVVANVHPTLPNVTAGSEGVVGFDGAYAGDIDLSALGNGKCALGTINGGALNGANPIVPAADGVIRFAGGALSALEVNKDGVLAEAGRLQIGSPKWHGSIKVYVNGNNADFDGVVDVTGLADFDREGNTAINSSNQGSLLRFCAYAGDKSSLGGTDGVIVLHGSRLQYYMREANAVDVKKEIRSEGFSRIYLNHEINPATLSVGELVRLNRGTFGLYPDRNKLGTYELMEIAEHDYYRNGIFPAWFVECRNGKFLTLDQNEHPVAYSPAAGAAVSDPNRVLELNAQTISGAVECYGVRISGEIKGTGSLSVGEGGVIVAVNKTFAPALEFGENEGVIYAHTAGTFAGAVSGSNGLTLHGTQCLAFTADNDLSGQISINGCRANFQLDDADAVHALGALTNPIALNGGALGASTTAHTLIRAERTIAIGENGGLIGGGITADCRITGPGILHSGVGTLTVTNPDNDYAGGTFLLSGLGDRVSGNVVATSTGKLGTGDLVVNQGTKATLQGDANLATGAKVHVALGGKVEFASAAPSIGGLIGCGTVTLGAADASTELSIGTGDADTTFYGRIEEASAGGACSLRKVGKGRLTLYGKHAFTGNLAVEDGAFELRGELSGGLVVGPKATMTMTVGADGKSCGAKVGGDVTLSGAVALDLPSSMRPKAGDAFEVLEYTGACDRSAAVAPPGFRLVAANGALLLKKTGGLGIIVR